MKAWTCKSEKARERLTAHISSLCKGWAKKLAVDHWRIEATLEFGGDVPQSRRETLDSTSGLVTVCNPSYERATIYVCLLDRDVHWTQREVEEFAAHEVVHILLSPITNSFSGDGDDFLRNRTIESVVTRTSRAFLGRFG